MDYALFVAGEQAHCCSVPSQVPDIGPEARLLLFIR